MKKPHLDLASFRELESFTQFGSDVDPLTKAKLERGKRTVEVLKQGQYQPIDVINQVVILYALTNGFLDSVSIENIGKYETELYKYIQSSELGKEIYSEIKETKDLPNKDKMNELLTNFSKEML